MLVHSQHALNNLQEKNQWHYQTDLFCMRIQLLTFFRCKHRRLHSSSVSLHRRVLAFSRNACRRNRFRMNTPASCSQSSWSAWLKKRKIMFYFGFPTKMLKGIFQVREKNCDLKNSRISFENLLVKIFLIILQQILNPFV